MKKYRIINEGKNFYPQHKFFLKWEGVPRVSIHNYYNNKIISVVVDENECSKAIYDKSEAENCLKKYVALEKKSYIQLAGSKKKVPYSFIDGFYICTDEIVCEYGRNGSSGYYLESSLWDEDFDKFIEKIKQSISEKKITYLTQDDFDLNNWE